MGEYHYEWSVEDGTLEENATRVAADLIWMLDEDSAGWYISFYG